MSVSRHYADNEYNKRVSIIIKYLSKEQLSIFLTAEALKHNKNLIPIFSENVEKDPELLNHMNMFEYLKEDEILTALKKIPISKLCNIYNPYCDEKYNQLVIKTLYSRFDELITTINEEFSLLYSSYLEKLYYKFDEEHKKKVISEVYNFNEFMSILSESKTFDIELVDRIIELYEQNF